jgi:putative transposase
VNRARADVKSHVVTIRDAPTYAAGQQAAQAVVARWGREFPTAMASLAEDLEGTLAHLKLPARHRKYVRTTNLIERSFLEEHRRTKIIPRFFDERSCLKLVYATLVRESERWYRIPISDVEREHLRRLRQELGIPVHRHIAPHKARRIRRRSAA